MEEDFDIDELKEGESVLQHLIAGAFAGTAEHCAMFPIDTVKTNMQAVMPACGHHSGIYRTTQHIVDKHGVVGLFRGVTAVAAGAAPAHAMHFATYELCKRQFGVQQGGHHPFATGAAGMCATIVSDAILTPMDAVKQRMQLGSYKGVLQCIRDVVSKYGVRALYAGYSTTLSMSLPFNGVYFASYESFRRLLKRGTEREFDLVAHFVAGGLAGSSAAALTTPFDVAKTRLQTQQHENQKYRGMVNTLSTIWKEEGRSGMFRGMKPRILLHSTSAAICWVTYEWMKHFLHSIGLN